MHCLQLTSMPRPCFHMNPLLLSEIAVSNSVFIRLKKCSSDIHSCRVSSKVLLFNRHSLHYPIDRYIVLIVTILPSWEGEKLVLFSLKASATVQKSRLCKKGWRHGD